jgi:hypothetical protein
LDGQQEKELDKIMAAAENETRKHVHR